MPRKLKSTGEPTQGKKTSRKRAAGAAKGSRKPLVADGGKWAGSGRKTAARGQGPEIRQQRSTGRGVRTRTITRTAAR